MRWAAAPIAPPDLPFVLAHAELLGVRVLEPAAPSRRVRDVSSCLAWMLALLVCILFWASVAFGAALLLS